MTLLRKTILRNAILANAISDRRAEIRLYEVNIFNFQHMAHQCEGEPLRDEFRAGLLRSAEENQHQKRTAEMVLAALVAQRKAVPWWRRWRA